MSYLCSNCGKSFTRQSNLTRHIKQSCKGNGEPPAKKARTSSAGLSQPGPSGLTQSYPIPTTSRGASSSNSDQITCHCCNTTVHVSNLAAHRRTLQHRTNACVDLAPGVQLTESAFMGRIVSYRISSDNHHTDFMEFFESIRERFVNLMMEVLHNHTTVKVNMELFGRYIIQKGESQDGVIDVKSFNTANKIINSSVNVDETLNIFMDILINQASEFQERDSGWALEHIMYLEVNVNKYAAMGGSSYIKLPKFIENKKAVINVNNQDQHCFLWAIVSALYPPNNRRVNEVSSYPHYSNVFDTQGMSFPLKLTDIKKFESNNNISINVYGLKSEFKDNKMIYDIVGPLHYSQQKLERHVNLLLITDDNGNSHYCWIKNFSRLVSSQINSHKGKKYFCDGCLLHFTSERLLQRHQEHDCNYIRTDIPSAEYRKDKCGNSVPGNILKFDNYEKQMVVPFVVYVDFESVLKPINTCEPDPKISYTYKTYRHEPYSFGYLIKCSSDDSASKFQLYRGADAARVFVDRLESDVIEIYEKYLKHIKFMNPLSREEQDQFDRATSCGICEKPFGVGQSKAKDHDHLTGKFRFAAHTNCNLNYKIPNFIPIICHNMSGYDIHMFIKQLFSENSTVDVIAQSKEKYISITKHLHVGSYIDKDGLSKRRMLKLRFIDSFKFMASSLQTLGANLSSDLFFETKKTFPGSNKIRFDATKRDSVDKLEYHRLPSKGDFYDKLNDEAVSELDYRRAQRVWELFNCQNLGEYSDIYLKSDVLLLCDVFQNFRKICFETYKLDPAQYFTAPGLAWDAMLRLTKVNLELLTDIDMIHMLKKGIRGGISQCSERKHIANNMFLPNYNSEEPSSFITYLDATNLYGHSMSQRLPTGGFTWVNESGIKNFDVMEVSDESRYGFILEVDVDYPEELHDKHTDLPFLAENIVPPNSKSKLKKLIPNLYNKRNYVIHYKTLQQAIKNGLILKKTHRVLKFEQSRWLKQYIDLNTQMRNNASNKFEKDFYKLMNNSVFGKTMENVDNRKDIRLSTHWENIGKKLGTSSLIAQPHFKTCSIFSENLVAIHLGKQSVLYCKPIYIGFCILELSKTVLYGFYYDVIKKHFEDKASLLYTDTDSLILKIYTDNFYKFIGENLDEFDTSNYKPENKFNVPINLSVLGKMKDEFPADPIVCFYGTGAKAYYVKSLSDEVKKAKGVKKECNQKTLND
ncbi:hypothetical protein NQ315_002664 [Exocentrus adspersus]|uniref:C2H2-type domain-containing protein n=1 Tax=Exocentrus adspersus TaxID=1586481 RepID=A0AAV8VVA6_9CUCU|nr:hypothetical protein NQ315_002664 [Exocentrus adspersus]